MSNQNITVEITEETIAVTLVEETIVVEVVESEAISVLVTEEIIEALVIEETILVEVTDAEPIIVEVACWPGAGGAGFGGAVFVTGVTAPGIVSNETYADNTVPDNKVLLSVLTDSETVAVHFQAEGGEAYSPIITIDGVACTNLQEVPGDLRLFTGSIPVTPTLPSHPFVLISNTGTNALITINQAEAPPEILACVIGEYPGVQTSAKAGDIIQVTGTVDTSATHVRMVGFGGFVDSGWVACSAGSFDIQGAVNSGSGLQTAKVYARNSFGSEGEDFTSTNQIILDQSIPIFVINSITYPLRQEAFKANEFGAVDISVSDMTHVVYTSAPFQVDNPTTYEQIKSVICTNPEDYNDSTPNYSIQAFKVSNNTEATVFVVLEVANVAPIITVSQPQARLRSSDGGTRYTITATSNQNMFGQPEISIPVSGTWEGAEFIGSLKSFTRDITIGDLGAKGSGSWGLANPMTNRAGIPGIITGSQIVGGFISREYALPAFAMTLWLGTEVVDTAKLVLTWTVKVNMVFYPVSTPPPSIYGYTLASLGTNPTQIIILDTQAAASSSQESTVTIEETI